jgi:hypothetical protein
MSALSLVMKGYPECHLWANLLRSFAEKGAIGPQRGNHHNLAQKQATLVKKISTVDKFFQF